MFSGWPARWSLVLVHLLVLRVTAGSKPRFCVSLISVTLLVGFRFFGLTGLSKFSFANFRFDFCSPPVTVKVLFVSVNSIGVGSIASLCSNYVTSTPGGGRGTWVYVWLVCAASLSEPLPYYSLFFGQL